MVYIIVILLWSNLVCYKKLQAALQSSFTESIEKQWEEQKGSVVGMLSLPVSLCVVQYRTQLSRWKFVIINCSVLCCFKRDICFLIVNFLFCVIVDFIAVFTSYSHFISLNNKNNCFFARQWHSNEIIKFEVLYKKIPRLTIWSKFQ